MRKLKIPTRRSVLAIAIAFAGIVGCPLSGQAKVSAQSAAQLGTNLTPTGAEKAGSADGVPPWTGGIESGPRGDIDSFVPDPFPNEKPLFSITSANFTQYADRLPEGQKALFLRDPDYRMDIYPSHRTAALPDEVYRNIRENAVRAQAAPEGIAFGVNNAAGGIPFPIPQDGWEAIWNHLLAFWGAARADTVRTYFVAADGSLELTNRYHEIVDFPYYYPGATPQSIGDYYFRRRELSDGPAALTGRGYTVWQPLDSARNETRIWQYLPGERRVRKAPILAFDTPTPDGAGIESFDDYYVFSGPPNRYEFRLLGKKEMYVPYNNNRFYGLPIATVAGKHHLNPDDLRYELHRVWVVDAMLANGEHHLAPHRRFYLDEDTWFAVYSDAWDSDGHLWKFSHGTMYLMPQVPAVVLGTSVIYDLENGGYVVNFAFNGEDRGLTPTAPHPASVFAPETLAAEGVE